MAAREQRALAREVAEDATAQERGPGGHNIGRMSPGFIHAVHPEHGEAVSYVPGEMLPAWVVAALDAGRGRYDAASGAFELDASAGKGAKS